MVSVANKNEKKTTTVAVTVGVLTRLNQDKYRHGDETLNETIARVLKEHEAREGTK